MAHPLDGARAKVERAIQHINKFSQDAAPFEVWNHIVRAEADPQAGVMRLYAVQIGGREPPPNYLVLLAGEIAYQLRSALDHVIYLLAKKAPDRRRQFPIFKERKEYIARAPSMIEGVSAHANALIETYQPYHGIPADQDSLWMLQDLNNTDKHRLIPTCFIVGDHLRVFFPDGTQSDFTYLFPGSVLKDGTMLCHFRLPDLEVQMKAQLFCSIAFEQIGGAQNQAVVPILAKMASNVGWIVESFAPEFP
jgi:hypothetical protein